MSASADRNLLLGVLALQLDFVGQDGLIDAMHAWAADKARPLGAILHARGRLSADRLALLEALVGEHLKAHGGDPLRSLAALTPLPESVRRDLESAADDPARASLAVIGSTAADAGGPPLPAEPPRPRPRYRVLRPHARGGLGEVYVAEDAELGREVALKEIRPEHAADPASRRRFVLEAEVTGGLEHPGVVPVYGLGTYADGRPFYAMRFVQGDNLQDAIRRFHAEGHARYDGLAFRELLGRFVDVCQAVAYAHSRGVLHRDLKPGNILLGKYGETLVVDWGLAKPLGRRDAPGGEDEATLRPRTGAEATMTAAGSALGTPAYMSPEQAGGRLDELGPTTDVYSLGATLYELLTGKVAFEGKYAQTVLEAVRAGRFPPPRQVSPAVPPALEAVCLKAMAREPAGRYGSALELADEVERWLADEPVGAYREPPRERARRWVKRHRTLATGAAAALLVGVVSLATAAALLTAANDRERHARGEAEQERDIAREQKRRTREALDAMTSQVTTDWLATQPKLLPQQRQFLERALAYYRELAREEASDADGQELVADAQFRVGLMLQRLGEHAEGEAAYRQAAGLYARLSAGAPGVPRHRRDLADALTNRASLLIELDRTDEAEADFRRAVSVYEPLTEGAPRDLEYRRKLALCLSNLSVLLSRIGRRAEAEAALGRSIVLRERLVADADDAEGRADLAASYLNRGVLRLQLDRLAEAEADFQRAIALYERLTAESPAELDNRDWLALSLNNLGMVLQKQNRAEPADAAYRRAYEIHDRLVREAPAVPQYRKDLATVLLNRGSLLLQQPRKTAEAEAAFRRADEILRGLASEFPDVPEYRRNRAMVLNNLGMLLHTTDRRAEAEAAYRPCVDLSERLLAESPGVTRNQSELAMAHMNFGNLLLDMKRAAEAEPRYRRAAALFERLLAESPDEPEYLRALALVHNNTGELWRRAGKRPEAAAAFRRAVALYDRLLAQSPGLVVYRGEVVNVLASLGPVLGELGRREEAEAVLRRAVGLGAELFRDAPNVREGLAYGRALMGLGALTRDAGDPAASLDWYAKSVSAVEPVAAQTPELAEPREVLAEAHQGRARALGRLGRHAEALRDCDRAVALSPPNDQARFRLARAVARARAGEPAKAVEEAAALSGAADAPAETLADAARVFAQASAAAPADGYAARAVDLLRRAVARGFTDIAPLLKDDDLAPLRPRADYAELLWDLADGLPPAKP